MRDTPMHLHFPRQLFVENVANGWPVLWLGPHDSMGAGGVLGLRGGGEDETRTDSGKAARARATAEGDEKRMQAPQREWPPQRFGSSDGRAGKDASTRTYAQK